MLQTHRTEDVTSYCMGERQAVLHLAIAQHRFPLVYKHVNSPCLPKKGSASTPIDYRLLAVFSAIYRVEIGAWFKLIYKWFTSCLHPCLHGGIPGHEAAEVSWDAQADIEHALINKLHAVLLVVDYFTFFDSFDHQ